LDKNEDEALTDKDYEKLIALRGRFCFVEDVLTKNYELLYVKRDEDYDKIQTPENTIVLVPEGEEQLNASKPLSEKAVKDAAQKEKRITSQKEYLAECEKGRKSFWRYTYYYRSSLAKAIHENLRRKLAKDLDKTLLRSEALRKAFLAKTEDRTEEELNAICAIEHLRWNAFTRAEGYSYGDKKYDLAKLLLLTLVSLTEQAIRNIHPITGIAKRMLYHIYFQPVRGLYFAGRRLISAFSKVVIFISPLYVNYLLS
jgi:hypothetical protein